MQKYKIAVVLLLAAMPITGVAQMVSPKPSAELKKLEYFTGNWTTDATITPGPWGAGGKFTASGTGELLKGGSFLVSRGDFSMPPELGGNGSALTVFGYDNDKKTYTEDRFDSLGRHVVMLGTLSGDTWTWTGENNYNGMLIKSRLTMKVVSPNSYASKYEVSSDAGTNWMTFWEGKGTKK
jgi:Protein of unknown function (DUF1579)